MAHEHGVLPAERLGVVARVLGRLDQRAQTDPDASDVSRGGSTPEVFRGFAKDELEFLPERVRLAAQVMARRIGRADDDLAEPGDSEQYAPIGCLGDDQRVIRRHEFAVNHHVHALAGCDDILDLATGVFIVLPTQRIHPDAGRVNDAFGPDIDLRTGFPVVRDHSIDLAICMQQSGDIAVVDQVCATLRRGACERKCESRVVELTVPVHDGTLQRFGLDIGQRLECSKPPEHRRLAQSALSRQCVIHHQAGAVERDLPEVVAGHDERQSVRQMGGVAQYGRPFVQRFAHQRHVALREVSHAAMDQFGRARRGSLGEVL